MRGARRATNRRRMWAFTVLLAFAVILGAVMLSTVLAAPADLAVEPPPPPRGVEPRPQPPIGRDGPGEDVGPVDPWVRPTRRQPEPVTHTGADRSTRSPGKATATRVAAPGDTAPAGGQGTSSPAEPSTAQPVPGAPTAARPPDPPGGADAGGVYYKNCAKARKAGALPLFRGEPGYSPHLDKDGDGEACDKPGRAR